VLFLPTADMMNVRGTWCAGRRGTPKGITMSESDLEKPVPDAEEQRRGLAEDPEAPAEEQPTGLRFDVDEADALEQHREVGLDEDDYR
jgi:hypothetical protein